MFKAIKEFFVGKPKQETTVNEISVDAPKVETETVTVSEPATLTVTETAGAQPVIAPDTVTISVSEKVDLTTSDQSLTVTFTPETNTGTWPFPNTPPQETAVKKKRTFVKREEPATEKKPTPAIKVNKNKPRKKK